MRSASDEVEERIEELLKQRGLQELIQQELELRAHVCAASFDNGYPTVVDEPAIVIVTSRIERGELARLVDLYFQDMVKYVVDVRKRVAALGGELHADGERLLLESGSQQHDLWGANYYPGLGPERCIEYTALINIRPSQGNRSMEIQDADTREQVREVTFELIGAGEEL